MSNCDIKAIEQKRLNALKVLNATSLKPSAKISQTKSILQEQGLLLKPCLLAEENKRSAQISHFEFKIPGRRQRKHEIQEEEKS
jgi:hypothetical protein